MINDGYTERLEVGGDAILYRPIPRRELKILLDGARRAQDLKYHIYLYASDMTSVCMESNRKSIGEDLFWEHWRTIVGMDRDWDTDAQNLRDGVRLCLTKPHIANRPCGDCRKWWYNHETGRVARKGDKMLLRPAHTPVPCETDLGCPKGHYDDQRGLSPKNRQAYEHYKECRAVYNFPHDPIVTRNALIIREVEDQFFLEQINGRRDNPVGDRRVPERRGGTGPVLQPGTGPYRAARERGEIGAGS